MLTIDSSLGKIHIIIYWIIHIYIYIYIYIHIVYFGRKLFFTQALVKTTEYFFFMIFKHRCSSLLAVFVHLDQDDRQEYFLPKCFQPCLFYCLGEDCNMYLLSTNCYQIFIDLSVSNSSRRLAYQRWIKHILAGASYGLVSKYIPTFLLRRHSFCIKIRTTENKMATWIPTMSVVVLRWIVCFRWNLFIWKVFRFFCFFLVGPFN